MELFTREPNRWSRFIFADFAAHRPGLTNSITARMRTLGDFTFEVCCWVDAAVLCTDPQAGNVAVEKAIEILPEGVELWKHAVLLMQGRRKRRGETNSGASCGKQREVTCEMCNPNRYWCEDREEMAAFRSFIIYWMCVCPCSHVRGGWSTIVQYCIFHHI